MPPSSICSDGLYVFLFSSENGLIKIGSGYGESRRGHVYAFVPEFKKGERGAVACVGGRLFYRSPATGDSVIELSTATLAEVRTVSLSKVLPDAAAKVVADGPLVACHRYLYTLIESTASTGAAAGTSTSFEVAVLEPTAKPEQPLALVRRIPLKDIESYAAVPRTLDPCQSCRRCVSATSFVHPDSRLAHCASPRRLQLQHQGQASLDDRHVVGRSIVV